MVEIESTPYIKTCTKWRFLEIAIHKWKICKRGQYCRKTTQTHSTHFVIVKFDSKPTNPGLNCLRMFARLEVDDQLPSPPVTKETPRSLSKLNVRRIFVILAQFSPRWRHRWYWRPWLQLRQRWSRPLPRWLRPDGKYDWLSFHRSEIATSFGLSWWTEVAGGAELLVSQGKATNGWKASCLLLAPVSSPSHCSWKVLLAGLLIKEAQARVREVQVSMEQGWWSHLCNQLYHNSLQKEYGEECSQWWSRVEWPGSWVCGLWRGVGWDAAEGKTAHQPLQRASYARPHTHFTDVPRRANIVLCSSSVGNRVEHLCIWEYSLLCQKGLSHTHLLQNMYKVIFIPWFCAFNGDFFLTECFDWPYSAILHSRWW